MSAPIGDRRVHARRRIEASRTSQELVRYNRQGRWYVEYLHDEKPDEPLRDRCATVRDAVEVALEIEREGGEIRDGVPGGGRFDYMVEAARAKIGRSARG